MLEAIHKETNQTVSAFKLFRDLEWQGKQRDKFISPYHEIGNWEEQLKKGINECEVTFVVRHKRYEGTDKEQLVREHFRIVTEGFIENPNNESEEHKLAKQYIYDNWENLLIYNFKDKKILDIEEIENIKIESGVGRKRADVLITFKKWHEVFGCGIAFEIQISPQKDDKTIVRSFDRATYGYSICWLWSEELRDFKNKVKVIPYKEAQKEYIEQVIYNQDLELSEIAKKVIRFTDEQREKIMTLVRTNEKILEYQRKIKHELIEENKEFYENYVKTEFKIFWDEIIKTKRRISEEVEEEFKKVKEGLRESIKKRVDDLIGSEELKSFLKNLPIPIDKVIIEKENSSICCICNSNNAFIQQGGKLYCKQCAYKINKI